MAQKQTSGSSRETLTSEDVGTLNMGASDAIPMPEGWENEQIGFPPYWNPFMQEDEKGKTIAGTGNAFLAVPVDKDVRNEDFQRYVLEAKHPIKCKKGPAEDAEEILVQVGEFFTCSVYAALPLEDYYGITVYVRPVRKRKLAPTAEINQKRDLWDFELKVSPTDKKFLKERRAQAMQLLKEKRERYRLEQIERDAQNPLMDNDRKTA